MYTDNKKTASSVVTSFCSDLHFEDFIILDKKGADVKKCIAFLTLIKRNPHEKNTFKLEKKMIIQHD